MPSLLPVALLAFDFFLPTLASTLSSTGQTVVLDGTSFYVPAEPVAVLDTSSLPRKIIDSDLTPLTVIATDDLSYNAQAFEAAVSNFTSTDDVFSAGFLDSCGVSIDTRTMVLEELFIAPKLLRTWTTRRKRPDGTMSSAGRFLSTRNGNCKSTMIPRLLNRGSGGVALSPSRWSTTSQIGSHISAGRSSRTRTLKSSRLRDTMLERWTKVFGTGLYRISGCIDQIDPFTRAAFAFVLISACSLWRRLPRVKQDVSSGLIHA